MTLTNPVRGCDGLTSSQSASSSQRVSSKDTHTHPHIHTHTHSDTQSHTYSHSYSDMSFCLLMVYFWNHADRCNLTLLCLSLSLPPSLSVYLCPTLPLKSVSLSLSLPPIT